jgi:drug/metabolite transporter (DMT)-like permease
MSALLDAVQRQTMWLLLCSSALSVFGQVLIKVGLNRVAGVARLSTVDLLWRVAASPHVYAGLLLYALSMVLFFKLLAQASLVTVGFSLAIGYVLLTVLAWGLLGETMTAQQWLGAGLILAGVLLMNLG